MKKSPIWTILVPAIVGIALLTGTFIGNLVSPKGILTEKPELPSEEISNTEAPMIIDGLININTAEIALLTELPGVGQSLAQRIVAYREENGLFADVQDLLNVSGIGKSKLEELLPYITIGGRK